MATMSRPPRRGLVIAGLVVAALVAAAGYRFADGHVRPAGPMAPSAVPIGGAFRLTSESGARVSDVDLRGRPFALYFGFTRCPDVCPTSMAEIAALLDRLGPQAADFRVYFVTVDPERDTPGLLEQYTDAFDPRIIGLTGTPDEIAAVATAYRAYYRKVPTSFGDYTMDHTATIFLMDANGRFAATIAWQEVADSALAKLRHLLGAPASAPAGG